MKKSKKSDNPNHKVQTPQIRKQKKESMNIHTISQHLYKHVHKYSLIFLKQKTKKKEGKKKCVAVVYILVTFQNAVHILTEKVVCLWTFTSKISRAIWFPLFT